MVFVQEGICSFIITSFKLFSPFIIISEETYKCLMKKLKTPSSGKMLWLTRLLWCNPYINFFSALLPVPICNLIWQLNLVICISFTHDIPLIILKRHFWVSFYYFNWRTVTLLINIVVASTTLWHESDTGAHVSPDPKPPLPSPSPPHPSGLSQSTSFECPA